VFEKFTERARQVVVLAQEEARALKHNYIGTEHILLGLLREEEGIAARVLGSFEITVERVRTQVRRIVGAGEEATSGQIPFTPRAKKVIELALREALSLGHKYIGTEHILLGLLRENEGVAARILLDFNADVARIRDEVIRMLEGPGTREQTRAMAIGVFPDRHLIDQAWLDGLGAVLGRLAAEIRDELQRAPDTGDLLLALAHAPDTLAAHALREIGVDLDGLPGVIQHIRAEALPAEDELAQRLTEVTRAKEQAIEAQEFERAAPLRDQERELRQQANARTTLQHETLQQIRRQLGLPAQTNDPPDPPPTR
jgi:ATP-dependent Clp protease ATP-binding subunit ClpA